VIGREQKSAWKKRERKLKRRIFIQTVKDIDSDSSRDRISAIRYFADETIAMPLNANPDFRQQALAAARLQGVERKRAVMDLLEGVIKPARNIPVEEDS